MKSARAVGIALVALIVLAFVVQNFHSVIHLPVTILIMLRGAIAYPASVLGWIGVALLPMIATGLLGMATVAVIRFFSKRHSH
jgi:hypothetical protein